MATPIDNGGKTDKYVWQQTAYDVTISFPLFENKKRDLDVKWTPEKFTLKIKNEIVYENKFVHNIKCESSTWYIEDGNIVLELDKFKKHEWWKSAFVGDEEIDTAKVTPAAETFSDLDSSTRSTIDKMLYEQRMKEEMNAAK